MKNKIPKTTTAEPLLERAGFLIIFLEDTRPEETKREKKVKIEVNKIMNPAFLLGTAFNIAYWHRKYHSGTICKGVSNPQLRLRK